MRSTWQALVASAVLLGCGCSDDAREPASPDATPDVAAGGSGGTWIWDSGAPSGGTGAASGGGGANHCPPLGLPKEVPPGFLEYTGYSCSCRFYVPGPEAEPLPPVEWEPCPQPGPNNPSCQRMKTPWTTTSGAVGTPRFWFDKAAQKSYVQFTRFRIDSVANTVRHSIIAPVDGSLENSIVQHGTACVLYNHGIEGGRYLFGVSSEPLGTEGFIGGKLGEAPDFAYKQPLKQYEHTTWRMTSEWVIRWKSGLFGRRWGESDEVTIHTGSSPFDIKGIGGDVFFRVGGFVSAGILTWNHAKGVRDLIRYPNDPERGAANFGTEGGDMVWTYGEGLPDNPSQWLVNRSIMTAPYSTDAETVANTARRLRSDPGTPIDGFAVGCGHAARQFYQAGANGKNSANLLVVRLSDGVSWIVEMPPTSEGAQFMTALGLTCEEVFTSAHFPDQAVTIVRIRLDSLGPGLAPD